jgi:CubicO group peptidase (beta-lactamase class C family)
VIAFALLIPSIAVAQHFPSDADLTALIQSRVEEDRAVGIVLGVIEADGTMRVVSFGDAGPDARPLGANSVFEIGSITKVFTGILLADMVARGEVALTDPVSTYLPDGATVPSRAGREITLLDLATHHSGLPRLPGNISPADPANPYADYTVEQMYEFLSGHELRRDIGSQYEYSNFAVGLLGHVLARVGGGSFEDVVRGRILEPLGMNMTGITLTEEMRKWMAAGHDQQGNVVPLWDLPTLAGAGALRSDIGDMLTFLAANTGPPESQLERSMRDSHEVRKVVNAELGIGLNWHVQTVGEDAIIWHNGGTGGFRSFIGFDPASGVGAIVLTNSGHGADDIGFHLINPSIPLVPAPVEREEVDVAEDILETYVGEYELAPTFSITVTLEGGALFLQATGQPKFPIFAESDTKFFLKVVDAQISFTTDDSGAVAELSLHQNGADQPARKVR